MTYLKVGNRWRYLAEVLDRHSRRVLGWALRSKRDLTLTLKALNRAVSRRRLTSGLIFHSDRGVEYSAYAFRARLAALGITQSMKRPREIGDNAFIESFFNSMKDEAIHARVFPHDRALREAVARYIRRYNSRDSTRRWAIVRPSTTKRSWLKYQRMECQQNRVNIPPLRAPLSRKPLGGQNVQTGDHDEKRAGGT